MTGFRQTWGWMAAGLVFLAVGDLSVVGTVLPTAAGASSAATAGASSAAAAGASSAATAGASSAAAAGVSSAAATGTSSAATAALPIAIGVPSSPGMETPDFASLAAVPPTVTGGIPLAVGPATRDASRPLVREELGKIHAWGLAVDEHGTVYAADGREEPGRIWKIDPIAFDRPGSEPGRRADEEEVGKDWGDGVTLLLEASGIRDLQLMPDDHLFVSVSRVVRKETASGDSVSVSEDGLLRLELDERGNPVGSAEVYVGWTSVDSLFSGPSFRVDDAGGVFFYWDGRLRYRDREGAVSTFLGSDFRGERDGGVDMGRFNDVRAMSWAGNGDLFLVDVARVRRVSIRERTVEGFASGLIVRGASPKSPEDDDEEPRYANRIYGLAPNDNGDRVWVAYHGGRKLLSVRRSGRSGTYYEPEDTGWGPVGVAWNEDGIWVLEVYGRVTRELRITRLGAAGNERTALPRLP